MLAELKKLAQFNTPVEASAANRAWGYVSCVDDVLYGSVLNEEHTVSPRYRDIKLRTESVLFFAMDAAIGRVLWRYEPKHSIRNNTIAVGLGFGLQEIFANFVCGLMIFFERRVRVGDVVTVDVITGTISKIRILATTITDWDRKEFVVPNKEHGSFL